MRIMPALLDNAMLYKDVTQWLRNRTFLFMFWGTLIFAEIVSIFVLTVAEEENRPGLIVFYWMFVILCAYGMITAFMGHGLTAREFQNRTFELYELAGMSLERMVGGKLLSMISQFLFGFFLIVPFMFFAYILGGLDFFQIVGAIVLVVLVAPLVYLVALLLALTAKLKQLSSVGRLGSAVLLLLLIPGTAMFVFNWTGTRDPLQVFAGFLQDLTAFRKSAWITATVFMLFYIQTCLLVFYLCCNLISRDTDSREIPVKLLITTLCISWFGVIGIMTYYRGHSGEAPYVAMYPIFTAMCILGLASFYSRPNVPIIVQNKYRNRGLAMRLIYSLFQPGPLGTLRTMTILMILCPLFAYVMHSLSISHAAASAATTWMQAVSIPLQVPFFLMFPITFFFITKIRNNYAVQRTMAAMWWTLASIMIVTYTAIARSDNKDYVSYLEFISVIISPVSTSIGMSSNRVIIADMAWKIRVVLGVFGLLWAFYYVYRRRAEHDRQREIA